jgi:hypothetical protein
MYKPTPNRGAVVTAQRSVLSLEFQSRSLHLIQTHDIIPPVIQLRRRRLSRVAIFILSPLAITMYYSQCLPGGEAIAAGPPVAYNGNTASYSQ